MAPVSLSSLFDSWGKCRKNTQGPSKHYIEVSFTKSTGRWSTVLTELTLHFPGELSLLTVGDTVELYGLRPDGPISDTKAD